MIAPGTMAELFAYLTTYSITSLDAESYVRISKSKMI